MMMTVGPHLVPSWSGFNAAVSNNIPVLSVNGYCPVIELSTMYTLMKQSIQMGRKLGHEEIIIVIDLAFHTKV